MNRDLLQQAGGAERIRTMMIDYIHKALDEGRVRHAAELFMALRHFLDQHPAARRGLAVNLPRTDDCCGHTKSPATGPDEQITRPESGALERFWRKCRNISLATIRALSGVGPQPDDPAASCPKIR
jgi:hypothetical protein